MPPRWPEVIRLCRRLCCPCRYPFASLFAVLFGRSVGGHYGGAASRRCLCKRLCDVLETSAGAIEVYRVPDRPGAGRTFCVLTDDGVSYAAADPAGRLVTRELDVKNTVDVRILAGEAGPYSFPVPRMIASICRPASSRL